MSLIAHPIRLVVAAALIAICMLSSLIRERRSIGAREPLTSVLELIGGATAFTGLAIMVSAFV